MNSINHIYDNYQINSYSNNNIFRILLYENNSFVENLIKTGCDINITNYDLNTVLHIACYDNNIEKIKFLLENGANLNLKNNLGYTPLLISRNIDIVILLLKYGANINITDDDGNTILHLILKQCYMDTLDYDLLEKLISDGVDIFIKNNDSLSFIDIICKNNYINIINFLVQYYLNKDIIIVQLFIHLGLDTTGTIENSYNSNIFDI